MKHISIIAGLLLALAGPAAAAGLVEPKLTMPSAGHHPPQVALTLDACSGKTDSRIIEALVGNRIPATVFVTARWLKRNAATLKTMLANPGLFEIENHGARHVPAVDYPTKVYGIAAAGSPEAVRAEIAGGASAVEAATGRKPRWYRGATGKYSLGAIALISASGEAVAGYSLIADDGATLPAAGVEKRLARARDGDVIIAHVNHPEKSAGGGLVQGLLALQARGFVFVKLGEPPAQPAQPAHSS